MFNRHRTNAEKDAFRLLVSPYHPDTLRCPASDVTKPSERLRHALTWNVFKTLEQIAPSLWMRPLVARCAGLPEAYNSAPQVTMVTCWPNLEPAPSARLRRGRRRPMPVSVIIDTDDTVITLLTPSPVDLLGGALSDTAESGLADVAEATAWLAGTRSAYVSVVLPIEADEKEWSVRVRRRAERVHRMLQAGDRPPTNVRGIGATTWYALHELLSEVAASSFIADAEKRCARTTADWMAQRLRRDVDYQRLA